MILEHPLMREAGRPEHTHQHSSLWNKTVGSPIFSSPLKHFFLYSYAGPFHLLPPSTTNSILRNALTFFSPSLSRESLRVLLNIGAEVGPLNWHILDRCVLPEFIQLLFFSFLIFWDFYYQRPSGTFFEVSSVWLPWRNAHSINFLISKNH